MSRWSRGIDAAYLEHESNERYQRVEAVMERRRRGEIGTPDRPVWIAFDGREFLMLPSGAMARIDGGDPGDENDADRREP